MLETLDQLERDEEKNFDFEADLAEKNAMVEYYYGVAIGEHYPLMKKLNQLENLPKMWKIDAKRYGVTDEL